MTERIVMALAHRSLAPFGVEVSLAKVPAAGSPQAEELVDLYRRDGLLVVKGLRLSPPEQADFCRLFGPVLDTPYDNFMVSNVDRAGHLGSRELLWHNDVPYLPRPYLAGCLHAIDVTPDAVGTKFASGYLAWEGLPDGLKSRVTGMKALHVRERVYDRTNRLTDLIDGDMCTVHDVVRRAAHDGREYLFVNEAWTALLIGLPDAEGEALQCELARHFYQDAHVYEHRWAVGDIVLWDNLAVQHARGTAGTGVRTLQRVTVTQLGYADQYPSDLGISESLGNRNMLADAIP
jgi:taurine dioxygenase